MRARLQEARASCKPLSAHWFFAWVGGARGGARSRDDAADFRPRTARIRDQGRAGARRAQSFVAQVMKAAAKANGGPLTHAQFSRGKPRGRGSGKGRCSRIGRGQAVADRLKRQAAERGPGQRQRRVVVKTRIERGVLVDFLARNPLAGDLIPHWRRPQAPLGSVVPPNEWTPRVSS